MINISGQYNNFQQYWGENTDDEIHKSESENRHRHFHLSIKLSEDSDYYYLDLYEGRNEAIKLSTDRKITVDQILITEKGFKSIDQSIVCEDGVLFLYQWTEIDIRRGEPYIMKSCRYFSGWIQYPPDISAPDDLYDQRELVLHDQGAMVELDVEGLDYTIELTQLVYGHTIHIMKLAIYDLPLSQVDINSKAISYTWVNPDATRVGINLRKVITGWTLMEEGYINSNNLNT